MDTIANHKIIQTVRVGEFATVYKVEGPKALKVHHPDYMRYGRQEAALLQSLDHPGIIGVLDSGICEDRHWFRMPWIYRTLKDKLKSSCLPSPMHERDTMEDFARLLVPLAYCHEQGVVQGDPKPSSFGIVDKLYKLFDFNLSTQLDRSAQSHVSLSLSRSGIHVTPDYAAPELLGGAQKTPQSDMFAMGLILYEMLTGQTDIRGRFPLPSASGFSKDLDNILLKALEHDLSKRYEDANAMIEDIAETYEFLQVLLKQPYVTDVSAQEDALLEKRWHVLGGKSAPVGVQEEARVHKIVEDALEDKAGVSVMRLSSDQRLGRNQIYVGIMTGVILGGGVGYSACNTQRSYDAKHNPTIESVQEQPKRSSDKRLRYFI